MSNYIPVLMLLALMVIMAVIMLALTTLVGPRRTNPAKELPFETGNLPTPGHAHQRYPVHYYLVAILFVVFDVEVAFLYPWAVKFRDMSLEMGTFVLVEMLVFLAILFVGWLYIIRRGVLGWK